MKTKIKQGLKWWLGWDGRIEGRGDVGNAGKEIGGEKGGMSKKKPERWEYYTSISLETGIKRYCRSVGGD